MNAPALFRVLSTGFGFCVAAAIASSAENAKPVILFDGKSLSGWEHVLADAAVPRENVWSCRDGMLVCTGTPVGVLYTAKEYTNFRLVLEYRWAPGQKPGNSGIMSRLTPNTGALPRTCEVQLQNGNAGDVIGLQGFAIGNNAQPRWLERVSQVAGKVTGVKRAVSAEKPAGEWNRVEIEAIDDRYVVRMNGTLVNEVTGVERTAGRIGLQSEGGEVHFRGVTITLL